MKKNLQYSDRNQAKRNQAILKKIAKKRVSFDGSGNELVHQRVLPTIFGAPILDVPRTFDFAENNFDDQSSLFLSDLEFLLSQHSHIYLCFKNTDLIRLPMFLCIYAIQDKYNAKISIQWSRSKLVNEMIKDSGSFASMQSRKDTLSDNSIRRIPVISGSNNEFQDLPDDLVDAINHKYYDGNIPSNVEARISSAIVETIENVGRHAYPKESLDENKKCWLICSLGHNGNIDEEYMYLAIYDIGRGIPHSFADSEVFQKRVKTHYPNEYKTLIYGDDLNESKTKAIGSFLRSMKSYISPLRKVIGDSGMIHASMMNDITRINDENHGQGSASIKDVVTNDPDSNLIILSNKGCYQYNKGSSQEHTKRELDNELTGALLQWSIKLNELS